MYVLIFLAGLAAAIFLVVRGRRRDSRKLLTGGVLLAFFTLCFFGLLSFYADMLWFYAVGYSGRFWTAVLGRVGFVTLGALAGCLAVFLLTLPIPRQRTHSRYWPEFIGLCAGAIWGATSWSVALQWWYRVDSGTIDPILGNDAAVYLFSLPFYESLYGLLFAVSVVSVAASFAGTMPGLELRSKGNELKLDVKDRSSSGEDAGRVTSRDDGAWRALSFSAGVLALVLASGQVLAIYAQMYSTFGVVTGPGCTDVHVRMPGHGIVAVLLALAGLGFFTGAASAGLRRQMVTNRFGPFNFQQRGFLVAPGAIAAVWILALGIAPALTQWLWVSPNEITVERPYIAHNIDFTRRAFGLDEVEERRFPVSEKLTQETIDDNRHVLSEVRLWDPRALKETYEQFQEIRLYYEFHDVDIDRYELDGRYRQVMVSPREIETINLPRQSQTFVNRRFKYTHGYGLTMTPVSDFRSNGLPRLIIRDLPPKVTAENLTIDQPGVHYGERTDSYVIANSTQKEFDYPAGENNVYTHYDGDGGVLLNSLWRKFVFGWKFGGTRFFVSGYPRESSRLQFYRSISQRVQRLAPFLTFDSDPYVILHEGRQKWIIDAYTTTSLYPYSEPFTTGGPAETLHGANYVRNSVKAVIDAWHGTVDFYVFEPDDPLIQVWQKIFPGLFTPAEEMPEGLRNHVRYPEGLLTAQGRVFARYHMDDPEVFYNQEDLWVPATEKYYGNLQIVEPYYVMWEPPGRNEAEFVLMQPFTPKNRQVMIGWIAGMCDGENYGRLLAYRFPKDKRVLGPQQVDTRIDQHRDLSGQLTLWDQRGSSVIRGNLLVIPIDDTLLYVEPVYLRAEAAAYPELRLVVVMHGDRLSYGHSFEEALQGLTGEQPQKALPKQEAPSPGVSSGKRSAAELASRASDAFESYLDAMGNRKFDDARNELQELQDALRKLKQQLPDAVASGSSPDEVSKSH